MKKLKAIPNSYWFVKEAKGIRGIPDIIGVINGRFVGIEVKRTAAEARKTSGRIVLQKHNLSKINNAHGIGFIIHPDNIEEKLEILRGLQTAPPTLH